VWLPKGDAVVGFYAFWGTGDAESDFFPVAVTELSFVGNMGGYPLLLLGFFVFDANDRKHGAVHFGDECVTWFDVRWVTCVLVFGFSRDASGGSIDGVKRDFYSVVFFESDSGLLVTALGGEVYDAPLQWT
jgi:hypothetical protein